jgi:hypothetical protein
VGVHRLGSYGMVVSLVCRPSALQASVIIDSELLSRLIGFETKFSLKWAVLACHMLWMLQ